MVPEAGPAPDSTVQFLRNGELALLLQLNACMNANASNFKKALYD